MRRIPGKKVAFAIIAVSAATSLGLVLDGHARAAAKTASSRQTAASASPTTSAAFLQGPAVQRLATQAGVTSPQVLVSAGTGTDSSAVVIGADASGHSCWSISSSLGASATPFTCGGRVGEEAGEPAGLDVLNVGCETSGSAGTSANAGSCVGFVGTSVVNVVVTLADGSTQSISPTDGAFAYAANTPGQLPTSFTAYDADRDVVGQENIQLPNGQ